MNDYNIDTIKGLIDKTLEGDPVNNQWLEDKLEEQRAVSNGSKHLYYRLFYHLSQKLKPDFTVELGGWRGLAAGFFAGGCWHNTVVTIDHHSDPGDEAHRAAMLEVTKKFTNVYYLQGWTWNVIKRVEEFNQGIDILFIDGWHQYEYAMKDWELYSPLLNNNALVICDDLLKGDSATIAGMWTFWTQISYGFDSHVEDSKIHEGFPMGFFKYVKS